MGRANRSPASEDSRASSVLEAEDVEKVQHPHRRCTSAPGSADSEFAKATARRRLGPHSKARRNSPVSLPASSRIATSKRGAGATVPYRSPKGAYRRAGQHPSSNAFKKHRKSKKSSSWFSSQSAYGSSASNSFWKHRKSKKSSPPAPSQSA